MAARRKKEINPAENEIRFGDQAVGNRAKTGRSVANTIADDVLGPLPEIITVRVNPVEELLKVKLELLEGKLELLTNRLDAHEKRFKNSVIEVLDEHVAQRFKEEQEETSTDTELSDKAEIKLHGIYHSEDAGVRIELDWNDQFINYLRSKGLPGVDDEQVVKHWLASMLRDIENSIDGKKKAGDSDFS